jgi:hypothetical protein
LRNHPQGITEGGGGLKTLTKAFHGHLILENRYKRFWLVDLRDWRGMVETHSK